MEPPTDCSVAEPRLPKVKRQLLSLSTQEQVIIVRRMNTSILRLARSEFPCLYILNFLANQVSAARLALRVLKAGGTAVDAVETAIRVLEDKEITNAGYGSNLSIDGIVEADATIVDHQGRSGACGAVARKYMKREVIITNVNHTQRSRIQSTWPESSWMRPMSSFHSAECRLTYS